MKIYSLQVGFGIYYNDIPPTPGDIITWGNTKSRTCFIVLETLEPNCLIRVLENSGITELIIHNDATATYQQLE
jgi:hypothetical protein